MSAKSKKSAKAIDRLIDAGVMAKAKAIAQEYQVILACEEGHWYGRGLYGDLRLGRLRGQAFTGR